VRRSSLSLLRSTFFFPSFIFRPRRREELPLSPVELALVERVPALVTAAGDLALLFLFRNKSGGGSFEKG